MYVEVLGAMVMMMLMLCCGRFGETRTRRVSVSVNGQGVDRRKYEVLCCLVLRLCLAYCDVRKCCVAWCLVQRE